VASEYLKWKYRDVRPEEKVELTPRQKRANWWYYHKWYVIGGAVLLGVAAYLLCRALGVGEIRPDYQVAYVGSAALPEDTVTALEAALSALGIDCDGDGRVMVRLNQYVLGDDTGGDALYAYAESAKLMADLDARDSYFFLLEDPEGFQEGYQILRRLDGTNPGEGDGDIENCCLLWSDCPVLRSLPLGEYTETLLGQAITGDSQELLSGLALARRGFWTEKTAHYTPQCDELWAAITKGALP